MSTQWNVFAFNHDDVLRHLLEPVLGAVASADSAKWEKILKNLDKVYPPAQLSRYAINGCDRPVTSIDWYSGRPDLTRDTPPGVGANSLDSLLKQSLEALARYRLVGTCFKPLGVFAELGYPQRLPNEDERREFGIFWDVLFAYRDAQPEPYGFLSRTNQQAAVALPNNVRRLAQLESGVGLLRRLTTDLASSEWKELAHDLGSLRPFIDLAANEGLAVYFRADGT